MVIEILEEKKVLYQITFAGVGSYEKEIKQSFNLNENYLDYCIKNSNKYHGYYPHCPYLYKKMKKTFKSKEMKS